MDRYLDYSSGEELIHFGILGMKWGVRRYQNSDGSLTEAGRSRYGSGKGRIREAIRKYKNKKKMKKLRAAKIAKAKKAAIEKIEADKREKELKELKAKITKNANILKKNEELARKILSDQEYSDITRRLQNEDLVAKLARNRRDRPRQTVEQIVNYSQTILNAKDQIDKWSKALNGESPKSDNKQEKKKKKDKQQDKKITELVRTVNDMYDNVEDLREFVVENNPNRMIEDKQETREIQVYNPKRKG